jgi:CubicO group peptidase (beta-lactamase class C family)
MNPINVVVGGLLLAAAGRLASAAEPDWTQLEATIRDELQATGTPGAAVVVVENGRVALARGFGVTDVDTGAPVTPQTLFQIGSMTKTLTAATLLSLAEEGSLRLDAPVGTYVSGLAPHVARLTTQQLLSQTSGLRDAPASWGSHEESALAASIRGWGDDHIFLPPGEVFSYSNPGFALAGLVLEAAAGKPYADAMEERLFKPLAMSRTTFRPTVAMTFPHALGHGGEKDAPRIVRPMADDTRYWPAGYAYSSADDLARFAVAFLSGGALDGKTALKPSIVEQMATPRAGFALTFDGEAYGYGLFVDDSRGVRIVGHGGQMPGFSSEWRFVPSRRAAVIVLANREGLMFRKTADKALALAAGLGAAVPASPPAALPLGSEEAARLAGVYENRWSMGLLAKDGRLVLEWGGNERPVTKLGEGLYSVQRDGGDPIVFRVPSRPAGRPQYLQMFVWAFKRVE